jgi:BirA family biotin operon repressor/biotin-[acetyl-CoA-carboxylase] ligase
MDSETLKNDEFDLSLPFNAELLISLLNNSIFQRNVIFKITIGSTNVFLKKLAQQGSPEGTVVIADEQSAGLGRMGREWLSKKGKNLLFSVLLRPELPPKKIFFLTMIFALAGIDAVQQMTGLNAMIKWPNDIYIGGKKLGGILTEFAVKKGVVQHVVLGMGLNVNWNPSTEKNLMYPTSSIFSETHEKVSRVKLLSKMLKLLEQYYHKGMEDVHSAERFFEKWNEKSAILGKAVVIETGKERVEGEAAGIDQEGALTLITGDGHERKFVCGDVSVKMNFSGH